MHFTKSRNYLTATASLSILNGVDGRAQLSRVYAKFKNIEPIIVWLKYQFIVQLEANLQRDKIVSCESKKILFNFDCSKVRATTEEKTTVPQQNHQQNSFTMPPNATSVATGVLNEDDAETIDGGLTVNVEELKRAEPRKIRIVWRNVIAFTYLHLAAVYGAWLCLTSAKWPTIGFGEYQQIFLFVGGDEGGRRWTMVNSKGGSSF